MTPDAMEGLRVDSASQEIGDSQRDLAANVIRVARGAERPFDIAPQAQEFLNALQRCHAIAGRSPKPDDFAEMLTTKAPTGGWREVNDETRSEGEVAEVVIRASLQIADLKARIAMIEDLDKQYQRRAAPCRSVSTGSISSETVARSSPKSRNVMTMAPPWRRRKNCCPIRRSA